MTHTPPAAHRDDRPETTAQRTPAAHAATAAFVAGTAFLALLALIHVIRPDVSTARQTTSEYAAGGLGWLMVLAFLLSAAGYGALAVAVMARRPRRLARAGAIILLLAAGGTVVGAVFVTDPAGTPPDELSTSGTLHGVGAGLALMLLPVAALLIGPGLARDGGAPTTGGRVLRWTAGLPLAALIVFLAARTVPVGWSERVLVVAYAAWQIIVARVLTHRTVR
ncbi:DUF998 domain-containing protein [Actinoplanes sp. NEAU-A12]|uniref:DUF998 domain-containing protein n=1 Tax=Actinoplanes sandaracinus TaxID=3045177 RepID=A0ABT6WKU7_9ACTN|nr:DUF998 domain-containing protein [Actinoplanes sandaracinus]MDI6100365.1 DUF998 domain-containing protein [Actinoplanes sandaracinus]